MKEISKTLLKVLMWVVIIFFLLFLIIGTIEKIGVNLNSLFHNKVIVEQTSLDNGLKSLVNGGLTPKEFEKQRKDENAPYAGDEIRDFTVRETEKYVIFSRAAMMNESTIYPNISFVKTEKGLVWDGVWGIQADLPVNWFTGKRDFNNLKFKLDLMENKIGYNKNLRPIWSWFANFWNVGQYHENIVTFSDFNTKFCPNFDNTFFLSFIWRDDLNDRNRLFNATHEYLVKQILVPYFELLDNDVEFEMGNNDSETLSKLNACFTYLWNNSKTEDFTEKETIVDVSKYYGKIIPEEERSKYPIPEDKQEEYGNKKYYSAYYCKIYADCYYSYHSDVKVDRDNNKIKDYVKDYGVDEVPENQTKEYSQLKIKFANKDNSDLIGLDLKESPVKFNINGITLIFDNLKDLENGKSIVVDSGSILAYTINSDGLVFDSYSGTLTANHSKVETYFKYSYMSGYVAVSVSMQPIMSVNPVNLDLSKEPYSVVFLSLSGIPSFSFVFDSNEKLNETITQYIPIGEYDVAFSGHSQIRCYSDGNSANFNITPSNRKFIFRYSFNEASFRYGIVPDISVTKMQDAEGNYITTDTPNDFRFNCSMNTGYPALLRCYPNATEEDTFNVSIKIFDEYGYVCAEIKDSHNAKIESSCSPTLIINSNFENGKRYSAQYFITTPDNEIFVSSTFDFIYESGYVYEVSDSLSLSTDWVLEKENGGK